ncbi:hypothetical protein [Legionella sp. CNM-4043-24]|uniref:hypothetical protein n=1 Tax=Legionella sp. CNM-4043-24 TaxID=3421646 RepID=UPI00403B1BC5
MHDLSYFRAHQHLAPFWAVKPHPGIRGFMSQADRSDQIGDVEQLTGKVSVLISDPEHPGRQLVIWGQTMSLPRDKSWLVIDGTKIVLSAEKQASPTTPIGAPSSSPAFFAQTPAMRPSQPDTEHTIKAQLARFEQEVIEKYFGRGGRVGLTFGDQLMSMSTPGSDEYLLTYKAQMLAGTDSNGQAKMFQNINESKRIRLDFSPAAEASSSSGYMY